MHRCVQWLQLNVAQSSGLFHVKGWTGPTSAQTGVSSRNGPSEVTALLSCVPFPVFCFDLLDVWEWFGRRAWWRQGYQSRTCTVDLKCCSNYCFHYGFVIRCLDAQWPAFHAAAGEAACFFSWSLISAGGKHGSELSADVATDRSHSQ